MITDSLWRLNNLYHIVDKNRQTIRFRQNNIQKLLNKFTGNRNIILKARQFGISTNEILKQFDFVIWNKNVTACILADEQDSIKKLFRIPLRAYSFLPEKMRPIIARGGGSKYEMYFPEVNSRIYCDLESHGDTINWLHVSEVALMRERSRLDSTLQAVPIDGIVTYETTPRGMNFFYDEWMDQSSTFDKHFYPWFLFPEYAIDTDYRVIPTLDEKKFIAKAKKRFNIDITEDQLNYRRFKQNELKSKFLEQYPEDDQGCFLASGMAVMDLMLVKDLLKATVEPIEIKDDIEIYKHYDKTKRYAIGADTAEGIGNDWSVACVAEIGSREQVAQLRGQLSPIEFAHKLVALAEMYSMGGRVPPILAVERNNHGHAVLLELHEHLKYLHIYKHKDKRNGWVTDRVTRPIMLDTFIEAVHNRTMIINSKQTLAECLTLINRNGKIEAEDGKHDDSIIAASICLQMCIEKNMDLYKDISKKIRV